MAKDICKLTGREGRFVDAHIVPKAFYGEKGKVKSLPSFAEHRPKRVPIGQYDPELVITETEKTFSTWDTYGIRFFRHEVGVWQPLDTGPSNLGYLVTGFDYTLLRLFFLSILWRATASPLVNPKASLQGHDDVLRRLVADGDPGRHDQFPVRLTHYHDAYGSIVFLPMGKKIDGNVGAFSYFGNHEIIWIVDGSRETIPPELYLRPDQPWLVLARTWNGSESKRMAMTCIARHPLAFGPMT